MARKTKTMDGNTAAAHVAYAYTDVASIFPITPSSTMAELADKWSASGQKNVFGQTVKVAEMQSEGGAAGALHGSLSAGALTTTFTASQGLLLMIPNMYKIAGELLPGVIHCSARALATHALSIFGDHSDVMACRQTGFAMFVSNNPQEVMDLAPVAHLSAIKGRVPFINFFDGFRTSHEMQKIEVWDYSDLEEMLDKDAVEQFRKRSLNPERPILKGTAQNPDIFFQAREAANPYYNALPEIVEQYLGKINSKLGTDYKLFNYYGAPDADRVVVAMGSVCDMLEEVIDFLNAKGEKVGLVKVHLYRPFVAEKLVAAFPKTVKKISVLDRTKEPGSQGEPLYLDVVAAFANSDMNVQIVGGRYGLGSKDTAPNCGFAVFENLKSDKPKNSFTVGINDDLTGTSLPLAENTPNTTPEDIISCKFWGLGSDGTVGANKNSIKIIGDNTNMYAQAYFQYDSKKSGGITISHLRFGDSPIKSTYYISQANFVACHNPSYINKYEMVQDLQPGGKFLLNCPWDVEELSRHLPAAAKQYVAKNNIQFYTIDGLKLGKEIGLGGKINTILQAAFFKITEIIPVEKAVASMKKYIELSYSKKGEAIVKMNFDAVDAGINNVHKIQIPADWATAVDSNAPANVNSNRPEMVKFVTNILEPVSNQLGDRLPVSTFSDMADGTFPVGSAAFEKRGVAADVPEWIPENCIQCNQCSMVCPHAAIRPFALDKQELTNAPKNFKSTSMNGKGLEDLSFSIGVTVMDCMGCGLCANICPAKNKALVMKPLDTQTAQQACYDYAFEKVSDKQAVNAAFPADTVKGSQFKQPLLEFSGACAGCGETPYAKLVTQLFGDRMYLANATGCSSIWGGSAPSTPYTLNKQGRGPAWANSLFEDNAEYGYGMVLAVSQMRSRLKNSAEEIISKTSNTELKSAAQYWLDTMYDGSKSREASDKFIAQLESNNESDLKSTVQDILGNKEYLEKKSMWIFGGDGWAYDIGFGGLDHVLASGEDVNIFVFDTEVYSNTGGQASKASQIGQVAQFAAAGKTTSKKDLAKIIMSYGYVYVAQVALGANYQQTVKALTEAESYPGPSLVIGYAPCINHGLKGGMGNSQSEIKAAVEAGYWHMFRFDPRLAEQGKNPFTMDSKAPTSEYRDFINKETRYTALKLQFPERAEQLFANAEKAAKAKYDRLVQMAAPANKE